MSESLRTARVAYTQFVEQAVEQANIGGGAQEHGDETTTMCRAQEDARHAHSPAQAPKSSRPQVPGPIDDHRRVRTQPARQHRPIRSAEAVTAGMHPQQSHVAPLAPPPRRQLFDQRRLAAALLADDGSAAAAGVQSSEQCAQVVPRRKAERQRVQSLDAQGIVARAHQPRPPSVISLPEGDTTISKV